VLQREAHCRVELATQGPGQNLQIDLQCSTDHQLLDVATNSRPITPSERCVHVYDWFAVFSASEVPQQGCHLGCFIHSEAFVSLLRKMVEVQLTPLRRAQSAEYTDADTVLLCKLGQHSLHFLAMFQL
jgi:hypothetical protein